MLLAGEIRSFIITLEQQNPVSTCTLLDRGCERMENETSQWRKSSYSDTGNCLEVSLGEKVAVRNSTRPTLETISISRKAWVFFVESIGIPNSSEPVESTASSTNPL
ncbi:DUF397 domain-containing protein [Streptomyces sp. NPDC101175]|uniref:DUF397 domain-containing protein n=1 Tax=Streptomyces sp. NPDC101175 TaxID=3366123 RepID=UPI003834C74D